MKNFFLRNYLSENKNTIILILIMLIAFSIRAVNLNYNSPFLDEALYLRLGEQILNWQWQKEDPFTWVGGMPLFYPTLSAIFGMFGGVVGARFLSVLLGTISVYLIYRFANKLNLANSQQQNEYIGLLSATLLAILAIPVFLSRWAIYDMLSFSLFLLGLVLLQNAYQFKTQTLWQREGRLLLAVGIFLLSFLAKYIVLILLPVVIIWALISAKQENKETFSTTFGYFVLALIGSISWYIFQNFADLLHFQQEQVSTADYGPNQILSRFIQYSSLVVPIALLGSLMLFKNKIKRTTLIFLLTGASIVPFVHVITNNYAAMHQHTFLSMIFLIPLGSYLLVNFIQRQQYMGSIISVILLTSIFAYSQFQVRELESSWANSNNVMNYLTNNTSNHEKILSSEDDVTVVSVNTISASNVTGIYNFEYQNISSESAYLNALQDGYFDFVLINDNPSLPVLKAINSGLTSHYEAVYTRQPFIIYKKVQQ